MNYAFQFRDVFRNFDYLTVGVKVTVLVSVVAMALAVLIGIITALARLSHKTLLRNVATAYIEAVRNTPLLIQLWLVYFGLEEIGVSLSAFTAGLLTLAVNTGAYTAEIIRAGFESVDKELLEAAAALGLTPWLTFRTVILPLGLRAVFPALQNMFIQCLLASSLLSVLGINELTNQAVRLASKTFRSYESFSLVAALYLLITLVFSLLGHAVNRHLARGSLH